MSDRDSVVTVDELEDEDFDAGLNRSDSRKGWLDESGHGRAEEGRRGHRGGSASRELHPTGELCTKILYIQSKKFFIDVKETRRGKILKLSEIQLNGTKSRMTMEMKIAAELHEKLTDFIEAYASLGPRSDPPKPTIMSESLQTSERRYYLDLKENRRGRFLKISMIMGPPTYERAEIVIPAQGMVDLRDVLTDLLSEFGKGEDEQQQQHEERQHVSERQASEVSATKEEEGIALRVPGKTFYAAVVNRKNETFLRISEVRPNFRTAVNVPRDAWDRFLDVLKRNAGEVCRTACENVEMSTAEDSTNAGNDDPDDCVWTGTSHVDAF